MEATKMPDTQRLSQEYDVISKMGLLEKEIPDFIKSNINPHFELRRYQVEAIARFIHYIEKYPNKKKPIQLLFNMATGSGKTLIMATNILYLFEKGYRNFLFFVNNTNIIRKTKDNFMDPFSPKYLFAEKITFDNKEIKIREVQNFDEANEEDINIIFTTIQGLHSDLTLFKENKTTLEDFADRKVVLISDEAHHINAWTRNHLGKEEEELKKTWEGTVNSVFNSNSDNIMLEYTATVDLGDFNIYEKYKDKIIFEYDLKQFRLDGYSKEVKVLQADLEDFERMLQAAILSQYRRKIAEKNRMHLKPVILFKSKTIAESKKHYELFLEMIEKLSKKDIERIKSKASGAVLERAFRYFDLENISIDNLILELKEDFSEEKIMLLDSENIDEEKQVKLNTLESENNEVRAIFAVNMLNEGWDVLNLFDIVRLYDTRDGDWTKDGKYIPGNTTIAERQLIGRGARYYPFKINNDDDPFKRKFDKQLESDNKILEELYYHSFYNPRYIVELTSALKESGLMPLETKEVEVKVKEEVKEKDFWKNDFLFVNDRVEIDRSNIRGLKDLIDVKKQFGYRLKTGFESEVAVLEEKTNVKATVNMTRTFKLGDFGTTIIRKSMAKMDFYKFNNLKKFMPGLKSSTDFIKELNNIAFDIVSSEAKLDNLLPDDKLGACIYVLKQIELQIINNYHEFRGTEIFIGKKIKDVVHDKILNIEVNESGDQEYGVPMSQARTTNLSLNLSGKDWYVYDENYGTSEEKYFIRFIDGIIEKLKEKYSEVYLLRNENLFKIYNFSNGNATEPDFVLFLKEYNTDKILQYQLFIEAKGSQLLEKDKWKEDFLKEIESRYQLESTLFGENGKYKIIGLPFYNEETKTIFVDEFKRKLNIIE
jgi:type III restriction enzyme